MLLAWGSGRKGCPSSAPTSKRGGSSRRTGSAASRIGEQSTTAGVQSTVCCVYGNPERALRHSATVTMVLRRRPRSGSA